MSLSRRKVLGGMGATAFGGTLLRPVRGLAQEKSITLLIWGTTWQNPMRELSEAFTKETGIKVGWETQQSSGDGLVKLQAMRDRPSVDVWFTTDSVAQRASADKQLFADLPLGKIPNTQQLIKGAAASYFTAEASYPLIVIYRPDMVSKPITRWEDLWDPSLRNKIAAPNMSMFQGWLLALCAVLAGGSEKNIDPGFKKLQALKSNVALFYSSDQQARQSVAQGEAAVLIGITSHSKWIADQGVTIKTSAPRPTPIGFDGCMLVRSGKEDLAAQYINYILQPGVQEIIANRRGVAPVNRNAKIPGSLQGLFPPEDQALVFDNAIINANIGKWTERFNRDIAS